MAGVFSIPLSGWHARDVASNVHDDAVRALESGHILFFPNLAFRADELKDLFAAPHVSGGSKNVSFDALNGRVSGVETSQSEVVVTVMRRYMESARALLSELIPQYAQALVTGRTSFRPVEIERRETSWRKDDTRLHVDSFPATPVQGQRILRVFSNVDPQGSPRRWRTGGAFDRVATRYAPRIPAPLPGSSALLQALKITRSRRTLYDHYMLRLHDAMKADAEYQRDSSHEPFEFPAGSSWIVYTDQVPHAALKGRCAFEQTFYLPVQAMSDASKSPLRTLERVLGRALV